MVKTQFSIKDHEHLSGIKAHTIRIWEKRYNLLDPDRTETNIRTYGVASLQKLLNITFLYNEGYKISKIAKLPQDEIRDLIQSSSLSQQDSFALKSFKTAMFTFDSKLFSDTYSKLREQRSFHEIFFELFIPLLDEIGMLWQTGTIDPTHESFISERIKQQIIIHTGEVLQNHETTSDHTFCLFLPYEEIHEIGLLYANYELLSSGANTIYLGANIPIESLKYIVNNYDELTFLTYMTIQPKNHSIASYFDEFQKINCPKKPCEIWVMGNKIRTDTLRLTDKNVIPIKDIRMLQDKIKSLKKS